MKSIVKNKRNTIACSKKEEKYTLIEKMTPIKEFNKSNNATFGYGEDI